MCPFSQSYVPLFRLEMLYVPVSLEALPKPRIVLSLVPISEVLAELLN